VGRKRHGVGEARAAAEARNPATGSRIHEGLVGARALVGTSYLADPRLRAEYERDIAPRTVASVAKVLRELFPPSVQAVRRPGRILDLGAGTGAVSQALRTHFGPEPTIIEVDRVATKPTTRIADVSDPESLAMGNAPFDLVVAAHVLNELFVGDPPARRIERLSRLVHRWSEKLVAADGTLILLEPALRETSRVLLAVRDRVIAAGLHIVAPCFFTGPCPALVQERDWCHDSTSAGPRARRIDFSYLVIRASGAAHADPTFFRIVSDPLPEKGRLRLFVCGTTGRQPVIRLDRNHSATNADLDHLVRGDAARITGTALVADGLRLDAASTVTLKLPPDPP
jgi:Mitochondrial small ribosomal subunit Rsm22